MKHFSFNPGKLILLLAACYFILKIATSYLYNNSQTELTELGQSLAIVDHQVDSLKTIRNKIELYDSLRHLKPQGNLDNPYELSEDTKTMLRTGSLDKEQMALAVDSLGRSIAFREHAFDSTSPDYSFAFRQRLDSLYVKLNMSLIKNLEQQKAISENGIFLLDAFELLAKILFGLAIVVLVVWAVKTSFGTRPQ
ncbi:hypothetical protein [Chryseolinea lacunae]|uniref:Chemotaxis methyl-accepting receptor HlyB-like 4HB MCP domain-containing protein n=1 Tax=Chryseolinea lacunae TaxID=2801331 RepID=A0ABS1KKB0_9BACT|nr:hypothetical protein [Chryseolinea lacunae]MBL0739885.1 hypothetical protein [Chryseolinea lacunae]